ncbi:Uncharacterised protein [Vibrio cholerae]|nr:Uncharacterised protein [Vibrio cholerae]
MLRLDPLAFIFHFEASAFASAIPTHINLRARRGIFNRVVHQIRNRAAQLIFIRQHLKALIHLKMQLMQRLTTEAHCFFF